MDSLKKLISDNLWSILLFVFMAGGIISEFRALIDTVETIEERLDKKIKVINALEERIHELEKCD